MARRCLEEVKRRIVGGKELSRWEKKRKEYWERGKGERSEMVREGKRRGEEGKRREREEVGVG